MGTGYKRADTSNNIATGNIINASDLDAEFDAVEAAFNAVSGHTHDGTAEEGGPIVSIGPAQNFVVAAAAATPKVTNFMDLGSSGLQFKNIYIDGLAYIDEFGEDTLLSTDKKVQFRDPAIYLHSSVDGQLDVVADVEIQLDSPTIDINAATAVTIDTAALTITGSTDIVGDLDIDNINVNGNTISSTDTNGNINLTPDGTGSVAISKVDINGGTIDGTTIGGSSAADATFATLNVDGGDIVLFEKADHSSIPEAGKGYLWVKSDTPSSLIFTDDAGTDYNITESVSSTSVVDDTTPQLGGDLYSNGSDIYVEDNDSVYLGTDGDYRLFYDGTNLNLRTSNSSRILFQYNTYTRYNFYMPTGDLTITGELQQGSDVSIKTDVVPITDALAKVLNIRGVTYKRKDLEYSRRYAGVIAQEVESVLPEVVAVNSSGLKSVAYGNMVGLLIEAIKELKNEIDQLKS